MSALTTYSGTFKVFDGTTDVTTGNGVVYSVVSETGCDASINASTGVYTLSSVTSDTARATLRATYKGVNIDKVFSVSKSRGGVDGSSAKLLRLTADRQTITYDSTGSPSPTSQSVVFTHSNQNLTGDLTVSMYRADGTQINANSYLAGTAGTASGNDKVYTSGTPNMSISASSFNTARGSTQGILVKSTRDGVSDQASVMKVQDGAAGGTGAAGSSNALVYLYQRSASTPSVPSTTSTYTFATNTLTGHNNGWSQTIPSGTNPIYATVATASSTTATDTIATGEWAAPVVLAQNGTNGSNGTNGVDGLNAATVWLYQRTASATAPALPSSTLTYTFATAVLSGTLGSWTQTVPAASGGAYLHVTTATAVSTSATDTIASSEWAAVRVLAQDGAQGATGATGAAGEQGPVGPAGPSLYTWIAYANDATGSTGFTTGAWSGQTYIGIANNKSSSTESTNAADYTWSKIQGDQGVPGTPGADGAPTYTWFAYASNSTGTANFTTGAPVDGTHTYVGIAANKSTATESTNAADYTWSRMQGPTGATGATGPTGPAGVNAITAYLDNEAHVVAADPSGTVSSFSGAGGTFKVFNGTTDVTTSATFTVVSESGVDVSIVAGTGVYTVNSMSADTGTAVLRATYNSVNYDRTYSISKSKAGATGATGATGSTGATGAAAKTLTITTDRQMITHDATGALNPSSQTTTFTAYKQNSTATVTWTMTTATGGALTASSYLSATTGDSVTMTAANFNLARGSTEGVIVTGTITDGSTISDKISIVKASGFTTSQADQLTTVTNQFSAGDNLIRNADLTSNSEFWTLGTTGGGLPLRSTSTTAGDPTVFWSHGGGASGYSIAYPHTANTSATSWYPCEQGKTYRLEWQGKGSNALVYMQFFDASGTELSSTGNTTQQGNTTNWSLCSFARTAPANAVKLFVQIWINVSGKVANPRLFALRSDAMTSPLGGAVNRNADIKEVASDGRPAFWYVAAGGAVSPSILAWKDATMKNTMTLTTTNNYLVNSAFKVEPDTTYEIELVWAGDGASTTPLCQMAEYDSALAPDVTHINPYVNSEASSVLDTRLQTLHNASIAAVSGSTYVTTTLTYTPTSTAKYASLCLYEFSTARIVVKRAYIRNKATFGASWGTNVTGRPTNLSGLTGSEAIQNQLITVNSSGVLTGTGTSGIVVDNTKQGWTQISDRPTTLTALDGTAATKLNGIETGATVGAAWGTNVTGRPTELTDGRVNSALGSDGRVRSSEQIHAAMVLNARSSNDITLSASDAGTTATISVPAHSRVLAGESGAVTRSFNSGSITGLSFSTEYLIYTDTYLGGAATYVATTNPNDLFGARDRILVGSITTPADGGSGTSGGGGRGGYEIID